MKRVVYRLAPEDHPCMIFAISALGTSAIVRILLALLFLLKTISAGAMTFKIEEASGIEAIHASGEISLGDAVSLEMLIHSQPTVQWLVLDSPGGDLSTGLKLGKSAREHNLGTLVPDHGRCLSACFFAFIGGVDRVVGHSGRLGMHQFRGTGDETAAEAQANAQTAVARLYRYVSDMGVNVEALTKALRVPSGIMLLYRPDQLVRYHLITVSGLTETRQSSEKIIVDRCTGKVVTDYDHVPECTPLARWLHITVPEFLAAHPRYHKGSALYEHLDAEVRRLQAKSTHPYSPEILERARASLKT